MLPEYPFYAPELFFNAWRRHFDAQRLHLAPFFFGLRRFFSIQNAFFVRIDWKYAVLTVASYASRKIFQPWLNIVPKRWEKVKFQAVRHLLRWLFEFWSASAFCLQRPCILIAEILDSEILDSEILDSEIPGFRDPGPGAARSHRRRKSLKFHWFL